MNDVGTDRRDAALETRTAMQGGELLLQALRAEGNTHIFAISDVSYNPVMREGARYGQTFIGARHESGGVHMADAFARISGRPGVVMAGMGPGVANMLPGVVCADIEGIPVIVIATQRSRRTHSAVKRGRFQYTPQLDLFRPCVKYAKSVETAARLPEILREAYRAALSGRPGPVYIEIPQDVMTEEAGPDQVQFPPPAAYRFTGAGGDPRDVDRVAAALLAAEKPLILAGCGIYRARAQTLLADFARRHGIPVVTTLGGRGVIPEDDPLALQILTPAAVMALREADLVLVLGTPIGEPLEFGRAGGMWGEADAKCWIQVDTDVAALGCNRPIDIGIVGDVRRVVPQVDAAMAAAGGRTAPNGLATLCEQHHGIVRSMLDDALANATTPVNPGRLVAEVRAFFPRDSIVCFDGGNTTLWAHHLSPIYGGEFVWTSKFGHLGTGMPYAMGAKLAQPGRPVYLITGDSAFGFNIQELETCARHRINIVAVINCDFQWGMEIPGQVADFGSRDKCVGVDHFHVRYDKFAEAAGCHGEYVTAPENIRPALERAAASNKPAVVQVVTDPKANEMPPGWEMVEQTYGDAY